MLDPPAERQARGASIRHDRDGMRDSIKRDLTPSQIDRGQVMAREIFERIEKRKAAKGE